jgi:Spy/CpxP family protein refolding chaperone
MNSRKFLIVMASLSVCTVQTAHAAPASAYAGQESREIKAMAAEDVDAYLSGKGMGLARAAELNGYPGPSHALALSSELELTSQQQQLTQALFATMEANAIKLGRALVDEERNLDMLFATKAITPALLSQSLSRIGQLQANVRGAHLEAHLTQAGILTPEQTGRYMQLRGYSTGQGKPGSGHHQH